MSTRKRKPSTQSPQNSGAFYMCPKAIDLPEYNHLSPHAIVLYMRMLDRSHLSNQNRSDWTDTEGNIFIYYTVEAAMKILHCCKKKALSVYEELTEAKLIRMVQQGFGQPRRIYVNDITNYSSADTTPMRCNSDTNDGAFKTPMRCNSDTNEVSRMHPNNTENSNTERNNTISSALPVEIPLIRLMREQEERKRKEKEYNPDIEYD